LAAQASGTDESSGRHSSARVSTSNGRKQALRVFQHPFHCDLEVGGGHFEIAALPFAAQLLLSAKADVASMPRINRGHKVSSRATAGAQPRD
jgi:hypothetical protein